MDESAVIYYRSRSVVSREGKGRKEEKRGDIITYQFSFVQCADNYGSFFSHGD